MDVSQLPASNDPLKEDRTYVTSLARGLAVMHAFHDQKDRLTLADVARSAGLPRATVRRSLTTLEALGYIERNGRFFSLTPQVLTLAQAYLSSSTLPRVAQSFLEQISETLGQSCSLSILHRDEVIYIARSTRKRIGSLHRDVGSHLPAHCTSMGRVLLAALSAAERDAFFATARLESYTHATVTDVGELCRILEKVRRDGYCIVDQEMEPNLRAISVPVNNASNRTVAALNVGAQANLASNRKLREVFLPVLMDAARKMRPLLIG